MSCIRTRGNSWAAMTELDRPSTCWHRILEPSPRACPHVSSHAETPAMELTVVVCTYNRASLLRHTLAALAAQQSSSSIHWDLVVVDNNSTDRTRAIVEEFACTAPVPTRYLFEPRQGLSTARNAGIAACRGDIVAFTDDDVTPEPDWVFRMASSVRGPPAHGVGGRTPPKV